MTEDRVETGAGAALLADERFRSTCAAERVDPSACAQEVTAGRAVYLQSVASRQQPDFRPIIVGDLVRDKIAALIGLGPRDRDVDSIVQTMSVILAARPDAVMDLTTNPEGVALRSELKKVMPVPLGACLTYDLFTNPRKQMSQAEFAERFERGISCGVDFVLVHVGLDRQILELMEKTPRVMPTTSRGGGLVSRYMRMHGTQNPLVEYFDTMTSICRRYGVVLDLGDIFRPGCLADAGDDLKIAEIRLIAELRDAALRSGTQVLCEAGGHIPLSQIGPLIGQYKSLLGDAPLWLAGPMPIDVGVTLDSTVNVLGAVYASQAGGNMFASITDNEHYAMPTAPDTAHAVRNLHVGLEAVRVALGDEQTVERNRQMGNARRKNDWGRQAELSLFPDLSNQVFLQHDLLREGTPCTICGQFCPHIIVPKSEEQTR